MKKLFLISGIFLALLFAGCTQQNPSGQQNNTAITANDDTTNSANNDSTTPSGNGTTDSGNEDQNDTQAQPDGSTQKTFSLSEVALHNSREDCWLAIHGEVYDVTGFIASGFHGGGDAILEGCGKDATEFFETRPMGTGTPHSDKARNAMKNFVIGSLA